MVEAAASGNVSEIQRLIGLGANVEAMDNNGNTPLILAAKWGYVGVMR